MPEIFRTEAIEPDGARAPLVVHCSDPRFQVHFQNFLQGHLKLGRYALVAVPGGAQFLTLVDYLPKFSWAGWRWMKFMVDVTRTERAILIGHDDCHWYLDSRFGLSRERLPEQIAQDLRRVRAALTERFSRLRVETYFARLENGAGVFETV